MKLLAVILFGIFISNTEMASAHPDSHCTLDQKTSAFMIQSKTRGEYPSVMRSLVSFPEKKVEVFHVSTAYFGEVIHQITVSVDGKVIRNEKIRQWSSEIGRQIRLKSIIDQGTMLTCVIAG